MGDLRCAREARLKCGCKARKVGQILKFANRIRKVSFRIYELFTVELSS